VAEEADPSEIGAGVSTSEPEGSFVNIEGSGWKAGVAVAAPTLIWDGAQAASRKGKAKRIIFFVIRHPPGRREHAGPEQASITLPY
jgi:hypothetical protein